MAAKAKAQTAGKWKVACGNWVWQGMAKRDTPLEFVITRAFFALRGYQGSGESLRKVADKRSAKTAAVEGRNSKRAAKSGRGSGSAGAAGLSAANPKGYRVTPETVVTLPDRCEVRVDTSKAIDIAEKFEGQLVTELRAREISRKLTKKAKGEDLDI